MGTRELHDAWSQNQIEALARDTTAIHTAHTVSAYIHMGRFCICGCSTEYIMQPVHSRTVQKQLQLEQVAQLELGRFHTAAKPIHGAVHSCSIPCAHSVPMFGCT